MRKAVQAAAVLLLLSGGGFLIYRGARQYFGAIQAQREAARQWADASPHVQGGIVNPPEKKRLPAYIPEGVVFSKIEVPRLSKTLYVVEGDNSAALDRGPGHVRGSAMPGEKGNCVIAGHRDLHFRFLKDIERGDEISIGDAAGTFRYRVTGTEIISPAQIEVLQPTASAQLHLITCYPFYFAGHAPKRFVVTAELVSEKPEAVVPELLAKSSAPVRPRRSAIKRPASIRVAPRRSDGEYERSIEATRALNRAAAQAL